MPQERLTKNERRDAAREAARIAREKQKRRDARNRMFLIGGSSAAIIAIFVVVALVLINANAPAGPGPRNMASDGIVITNGDNGLTAVTTEAIPGDGTPTPTDTAAFDTQLHIVTYLDYLCPFCNQFETANSAAIEQLVESGLATLEVHPISILDRVSAGSKYPTRAASAAACVADLEPDAFLDVNRAFFAAQPEEGTSGLTNDDLVGIAQAAGVTSEEIVDCIRDERFTSWVAAATSRALADDSLKDSEGNFGTPRVLVNGQIYNGSPGDAASFQAFVGNILVELEAASPTPTPTPTS